MTKIIAKHNLVFKHRNGITYDLMLKNLDNLEISSVPYKIIEKLGAVMQDYPKHIEYELFVHQHGKLVKIASDEKGEMIRNKSISFFPLHIINYYYIGKGKEKKKIENRTSFFSLRNIETFSLQRSPWLQNKFESSNTKSNLTEKQKLLFSTTWNRIAEEKDKNEREFGSFIRTILTFVAVNQKKKIEEEFKADESMLELLFSSKKGKKKSEEKMILEDESKKNEVEENEWDSGSGSESEEGGRSESEGEHESENKDYGETMEEEKDEEVEGIDHTPKKKESRLFSILSKFPKNICVVAEEVYFSSSSRKKDKGGSCNFQKLHSASFV